ncbi:MAG TPA: hypothetical protein DD620_04315 [Verrucomicrobia bacterium]|nr:hypothetical protein [Verrucomicrobiota bacterium]
MKRAVILILLPGLLWAQDAVVPVLEKGMTVEGLRSPFYNAQGERIAELIGGRARMQTPEVADVEHLRIDIFEGAHQTAQLYAPRCQTRIDMVDGVKHLIAESDGLVLIVTDAFRMTGRGFRFDTRDKRFEVLNEVKILGSPGLWKSSGALF